MTDETGNFAEAALRFIYWYGPATFFRCPWDSDPAHADIAIIGVPFSGGNPIERGQYLGPRAIRNTTMGYRRAHREWRVDPFEICRINDLGDVPIIRTLNAFQALDDIRDFYRAVDAAGARPLSVGGDHSITTPILRCIAGMQSRRGGPVAVVHFDSHTDSYEVDSSVGGVENAGTWARIGVDEGLIDPASSVMVGMNGPHPDMSFEKWAYETYRVIELDEFDERGVAGTIEVIRERVGTMPVYLTFDLDVLDLPWAPAVADPEVGGLTARQAIKLLRGLRGLDLVGADFVCFVGRKDTEAEVTALTAAALMHETLTLLAESAGRSASEPADTASALGTG